MQVLLIGAGHTGLAAACYLARKNIKPIVYTRDADKAALVNASGLLASGAVEGLYHIPATADLNAALAKAELILISTWANAHREVFTGLKSLLRKNQSILVLNSNWGALEGYQVLGNELKEKNVALGETASQPFLGCWDGKSAVYVKAVKEEVTLAGIRHSDTVRLRGLIKPWFKSTLGKANVLETSLSSANPIIHLPVAVFNLQRIEGAGRFYFLGEMTRHVAAYIEQADAERVAVGKKIGVQVRPILEELNSFWPVKYPDLLALFHENPHYQSNLGPTTLKHRFILEDLPYGYDAVAQLGKLYGVPIPYTRALADFARLALGEDILPGRLSISKEEVEMLKNCD